ncbi:MAG: protein kinase [Cyanobacteria bacterium HKST-UBA02]|nr:protein kinase [Cyanobacteria bacterium HKST-UBA02]
MSQDQSLCPKCRRQVTASQPASITQWLSVCRCGSEDLFLTQSLSVHICSKCAKRVNCGRQGTLSQYIFRHDLCSCPVPDPVLTEVEAVGRSSEEATEDDDSEELPLSEEEFPVERYKPLKMVGKGAAGNVYLCRDRLLNKKVAVKMLSILSANELLAFQEEARALSKLQHACIVSILDFGASQGELPYMVLEYVPGVTMEQYLDEHGAMTAEDACFVMDQVCQALAFAHRAGIYHRDVKPSNILLVSDEESGLGVRLIDFGVARLRQEEGSPGQGRTLAGTPAYMSPDQASGLEYDARSEVYSLGCVLFELLTGRPPFEAESPLEMLSMHAAVEPPLVSSLLEGPVSGDLEEIVATCLAKSQDDRYQSVDQLRNALMALSGAEDAESELPARRGFRLSPMMTACGAALLLILGILFYFSFSRDAGNADPGVSTEASPAPARKKSVVRLTVENTDFNELSPDKNEMIRPIGEGGTLKDAELEDVAELLRGKEKVFLDLSADEIDGSGLHFLCDSPIHGMLLSQNRLNLKTLEGLKRFKHLEVLRLSYTNVDDDSLSTLAGLKSLSILDLDHCKKVTDEGVKSLIGIPGLQALALTSTGISDQSATYLRSMPALEFVFIEGTGITNAGLVQLSGMKRLRGLFLRNCSSVDGAGVSMICRAMPRLERMSLGSPALKEGDFVPLRLLKKLLVLNLYNCNLGSEDLKAIGTLKELSVLYISHGLFDDNDLPSLYGLKKLRSIGLWECDRITTPGLAELREHLTKPIQILSDKVDKSPLNEDVIDMWSEE